MTTKAPVRTMTIYPTGVPEWDRQSLLRAQAANRAAHAALAAVQALRQLTGDDAAWEAEFILQRYVCTVTEPTATAWWHHFNPLPPESERTVPTWGTYGT